MLSYSVEPSTTRAKLDYWNRAMREVFRSTWNVRPDRPTDFHMQMKAVPFGNMVLSHATLSQTRLSNNPQTTGTDTGHPYSIYTVNRRQFVSTGGSSFVLEPGDFTLVDSAMASTMNTDEPYTTIGLTVPADFLRRHVPNPEKAVGMRFSGNAGLTKTVSYMLLTMWELAESGALSDIGSKVAGNLLEIFSACCYMSIKDGAVKSSGADIRRRQVKQLIDNELRNPGLTIGDLARELGVSSRYMQMLFATENCTVSRYIRQQRLEGCRQQLADPAWREHSITEIAFSWGFNNSTHFARAFREQFGISAREFRKRALHDGHALDFSRDLDD